MNAGSVQVQDFTQAQLRLFLLVCQDPNGLFFTGDTCQTIQRGVGFRFCDLRSMFWNAKQGAHSEVTVPDIFQLTVNYRK